MSHQTKEEDRYFFVDNPELHRKEKLERLIDNLASLLDGKKTVTREHEQVLFKGMHACGYALTKLKRGCAAGRRKKTLVDLYNQSREVLVKLNMGLIGDMRKKTRAAHGQDNSDLVSEGNFSLVNAMRQFDPWRGFKFSTYCCTSIQRGFSHLARKNGAWYGIAERMAKVLKTRNLGRGMVSAEHERMLERLRLVIRENYAGLTDMELYVLSQRVLHDPMQKVRTLEDTGSDFDLSKERIRQYQVSAVKKLQIYFGVIEEEETEEGEIDALVEEGKYCLAACA